MIPTRFDEFRPNGKGATHDRACCGIISRCIRVVQMGLVGLG
jgi:hypothetical protein